MSAAYWAMKRQADRYRLTMAQHNADIKLTNMAITHELIRPGDAGYDEPMPLRRDKLPSHLVFMVVSPEDVPSSPYYYSGELSAPQASPEPISPVAKHQPLAKPPEIASQEHIPTPQEMRRKAIEAAQDAGDRSATSQTGYSRNPKEFL